MQKKLMDRDQEELEKVNHTWTTIKESTSNPFSFPPGLEGYDVYSPLQACGMTTGGSPVDLEKKWRRIVLCYNTLCADFKSQNDM